MTQTNDQKPLSTKDILKGMKCYIYLKQERGRENEERIILMQ